MVSSKLKEKFEGIVSPWVAPLGSLGLTPNILTVLGLATSTVAAWAYLNWRVNRLYLVIAGVLVLLSGFMDVLDGVLARETGKVSPFGGFFDSVADRYSDAVVLSSITASGLCHPAWGLTALVGSLMVSYSRARAEAAGVKMIAVGFAERAERMLLLIASTWGAFWRIEGLGWGITLLALLANLTVVQRSIHFYRQIRTS